MKLATQTPQRFGRRVRQVIDAVNARLEEYTAAGFNVTLRQLFYRLVSDRVLVNRASDYRNLGRYINQAKKSGLIDWDWVEDTTRKLRGRKTYSLVRKT